MNPKWSMTVERVVRQSGLLKQLKQVFGRSFELSIDREDGKIRLVMQEQDSGAELMTVADLAVMLQMDKSQVRRLTKARAQKNSGHPLPFVKIHGKLLRFQRSDVMKWIEAQKVNANGSGNGKLIEKRKKVTR